MRAKTVFIGNGINYLGENPTGWNDLLQDLMGDEPFDIEELPYVMAYEKIRFDWQHKSGKPNSSELKKYIANKMSIYSENETCKKILNSGFSHYITTNYDHTIEHSFLSLDDSNTLFSPEKNTDTGEKNYSIRRKTELQTSTETVGTVWHIHGEIDPCQSIMLGFNHYVGSLAKIDSYLKGKYESDSNPHITKNIDIKKIKNKVKENTYDGISWIELFFNSDVHIVGFGFDFYEIDLWNILTKRARLISESVQVSNKIYYYTKPLHQVTTNDKAKKIEIRKREMLKNLSVEIIEVELHKDPSNKYDYKQQWNEFLDIMTQNKIPIQLEDSHKLEHMTS
ncbi:MAG: SIR2 family protein [Acinetobacter sp.]